MLKKISLFCFISISVALCFLQQEVFAEEGSNLPEVLWESRWTEELANGNIKEHPPFVSVNNVKLRRFSDMQSVIWKTTLLIQHDDRSDNEELYVFSVWQGGASQGEQLMLLSASKHGVDVIGPFAQDFETLKITPVTAEFGPVFELYGADMNEPLARVEYYDGQLIEMN